MWLWILLRNTFSWFFKIFSIWQSEIWTLELKRVWRLIVTVTSLYTVSVGSMSCKQSTKGGRCIRKRTKELSYCLQFFFVVTQSFLVGSARKEANVLKPCKVSFFSLYSSSKLWFLVQVFFAICLFDIMFVKSSEICLFLRYSKGLSCVWQFEMFVKVPNHLGTFFYSLTR